MCVVALCPLAHGHHVPCCCSGAQEGLLEDLQFRWSPSSLPVSLPGPLPPSDAFPNCPPVFVAITPCLQSTRAATHLTCASPTSLRGLTSDPSVQVWKQTPRQAGSNLPTSHSQLVGAGLGFGSFSHISSVHPHKSSRQR